MARPSLHIQNIYDVLNPTGTGVGGFLKQKSLQLQNRAVDLADSGDIVTVSDDCPQSFIDYMLHVTGASDVLVLRYQASRDPLEPISARSVFESLSRDPSWGYVKQKNPRLEPYMKSAAVYEAACESGIEVSPEIWKMVVIDRLIEKMNDKAVLHRECAELGIPVPRHWIVSKKDAVTQVLDLLSASHSRLYIRKTRSAGAYGNMTVELVNSKYLIYEPEVQELRGSEFVQVLQQFIVTSLWDEFVVSELLDLYASPGTLYFAGDTGTYVVCHTFQILNRERRYTGFQYPIKDEFISRHFEAAEKAVHSLIEPWRRLGFRGYGNIDWMVTKDDEFFIAERNARQTAIVPSLKIANDIMQPGDRRPWAVPQAISILTRDRIPFNYPVDFDDVHAKLRAKGLLWGQGESGEGAIITVPPSPTFGINTAGVMVMGDDLSTAHEVYLQIMDALESQEEELLFPPRK